MKLKNLFILGVATIAIIFVSMFATHTEESNVTDEATGKLLFENLQSKINDITQVEILSGVNIISISKMGDAWVVAQKYNLPANIQQLKQLFLTLATSRIIERKTTKTEQYSKIGVEDANTKDAKSTAVTLKNSAGDILAAAILGKSRPLKTEDSKDAFYIRKIDEPQSWLVTGKIEIGVTAASWLLKDIVNIDRTRIKSVLIDHPEADVQPLKIEKIDPSASNYSLVDIPKGKEIRNTAIVNNLALGIKEIELEDIFAKNDIKFEEKSTNNTKFATYDGLVINIKTMKKDNIWYTQYSASAADDSPAEVKAEVTKLNGKFNDWVYVIPSYKAVNFKKKMNDLAKDKR